MDKIDLVKLIRASEHPLLRKLPFFLIYILKLLIREKSINKLLSKTGDLEGYEFLDRIMEELNIRVELNGVENLPGDGRVIFAANHPFGLADGLVLAHTISGKYGSLKAIGNEAFMLLKPLHLFIFSVNVYGTNTKEKIRQLDELYASSYPISHFPSGEVSRRYHGKIQDCAWQKSFITKSVQHQRPIVPIFFEGTNSKNFYFIHWIRKKLGISLNLELALLPREVFNKRGKTIRVYIGKPVPYQIFHGGKSNKTWCEMIRNYTYSLGEGFQGTFEEKYQL